VVNQPKERIEVLVDVRGDVGIKTDAQVRINKEGFIGEQYLEFSPGRAKTFLPKDGTATLEADSPVDLVGEVSTLFTHLNELMSDETFRDSLRKTAANMEKLTARGTKLAESADSFVGSAKDTSKLTQETLHEMKALAAELRKAAAEARPLATDLRKVTARVDATLAAVEGERIARSLEAIEHVVTRIAEGHGVAGRLVADEKMEEELVRTVRELRETVTLIREHPVRWWYGPEKKGSWWWPFGGGESAPEAETKEKTDADGTK
jgi:ABC-type transporter Mla subunit MlaD